MLIGMSAKGKQKQRSVSRALPSTASSTYETLNIDTTEESTGDILSSFVFIFFPVSLKNFSVHVIITVLFTFVFVMVWFFNNFFNNL